MFAAPQLLLSSLLFCRRLIENNIHNLTENVFFYFGELANPVSMSIYVLYITNDTLTYSQGWNINNEHLNLCLTLTYAKVQTTA